MKFFERPIYFCSNCKTIVEKVDDLYFVEETSPRAFCSEKCIEEFYFPFIDKFEKQKNLIREEMQILEPELEDYLADPEMIDDLFSRPDEIWVQENLLKEEIYCFLFTSEVNGEKLTFISMCMVFNYRPSFVLAVDVTKNEKIIDLYRMGQKVEDLAPFHKAALSDEDSPQSNLEEIEQRKGTLLASLLQNRKDTDIQVDQFHLYDTYLFATIESPDLINEWSDENSDSYHVCSKAFELEGNSFYYIVICLPSLSEDSKFIPILGFPTLDGELYSEFTAGKRLSGILKN